MYRVWDSTFKAAFNKIKSKEKLFIYSVLYEYGINDYYHFSIEELDNRLPINKRAIQECVSSLIEKKFIEKNLRHVESSTRYEYKFSFITELNKLRINYAMKEESTDSLTSIQRYCLSFSKEGLESNGYDLRLCESIDKLSYAGRLILFYLEGFIDFNAVASVPTKKLSELSCSGPDAVRSQLRKMEEFGLIRKLSSGFTGKYFLGVKSSVYVICCRSSGRNYLRQYLNYKNRISSQDRMIEIIRDNLTPVITLLQKEPLVHQVFNFNLSLISDELSKPQVYGYIEYKLIQSLIKKPELLRTGYHQSPATAKRPLLLSPDEVKLSPAMKRKLIDQPREIIISEVEINYAVSKVVSELNFVIEKFIVEELILIGI